MTGQGSWRTIRQGLERQLVEAGDFDGWPAGATGESYLADIAGKGTCETTSVLNQVYSFTPSLVLLAFHFSKK